MSGHDGAARPTRRLRSAAGSRPAYAALDLGTNNCRLLIAERAARGGGFRVLDSHSSISRLGEGLAAAGRLGEAPMERTLAALRVCAAKLARYPSLKLRAVATQACRAAENGAAFLARAHAETGLAIEIIEAEEEARLAAIGCAALVDPAAEAALVLDIGGGSTELSWLVAGAKPERILAWTSLNVGVVTLAERLPEPENDHETWFSTMREAVAGDLAAFRDGAGVSFAPGKAHLVGTSGALSSLGGVHLGLARYSRARVDGLWMRLDEVVEAGRKVRGLSREARAQHPCIGPDRKDLILPGAAIVEAVCAAWPLERVRVADRGLREGILLQLMAEDDGRER